MSTVKERGIRIGINQLVTYATLTPILWFVAQPLLIDAMAEDIKQIVAQQNEPIQDAFAVLLLRDINALKRSIAADEFRQGEEDWTAQDSIDLASKKIELQALQEALGKLQQGE